MGKFAIFNKQEFDVALHCQAGKIFVSGEPTLRFNTYHGKTIKQLDLIKYPTNRGLRVSRKDVDC